MEHDFRKDREIDTQEWRNRLTESSPGEMFPSGLFDSEEEQELWMMFPEEELIRAPHYLKSSILQKARAVSGGCVVPMTRAQKRKKLFLYSLKVAVASAAIIMMVFLPAMPGIETGTSGTPSVSQSQNIDREPGREEDSWLNRVSESASGLCEKISSFTNQLTQWEVFKYEHEQKEK